MCLIAQIRTFPIFYEIKRTIFPVIWMHTFNRGELFQIFNIYSKV